MTTPLLLSSLLVASVVTAAGCIDTASLQMPSAHGGTTGRTARGGSSGGMLPGGRSGASDPAGAGGATGTGGAPGADGAVQSGTGVYCGLSGLVAHYPFDGDTKDSSGGGHDIVATSVTTTTGLFGGAYAFDGSSSQMRVTGSADSLGARTLCAWVKPESEAGAAQPVFAGGDVGAGDFFSLTSSTPLAANTSCMGAQEGEPFLDHWNTGCVSGTGLIAHNGVWSLGCYAFDGIGSERFFVNGDSHDEPGENFPYPVSTLSVGSSNLGGTTTRWAFRGAIDEVTVWGRGLSSSELSSLWNGGLGCTSTGSGGIALGTDANGWLAANAAGAVGRWWSTGDDFARDGTPGEGTCPTAGFPMTACSTLTTPTPGTPFPPDANGRMCTAGTAAQVVPGRDGTLAWSAIWGNIIGVNLATSDPSPLPVLGTYDAPAHGITGFAFDMDGDLPLGRFRMTVQTAENDNDPAYWYGATMDLSPYQGPGHYEIRWPDVGGPMYLGPGAPPFDPTKIESISFDVPGRDDFAASYDFCIGNFALLTN